MADGGVGLIGWQRRPEPLKSFEGVAYAARATSRIDGGKLSGTQLMFLESYKKQWTQNYLYVIPLADVSMVSLQGEILSGLNTTKDMDIELAVTFGAGVGTPTVRAMAITSSYDMRDAAALFAPRLRAVQLKGGSAGDLELDNVHQRRDGTEWIRRVHGSSPHARGTLHVGAANAATGWNRSLSPLLQGTVIPV